MAKYFPFKLSQSFKFFILLLMSVGAIGCGAMTDFATQPMDGETAAGAALDEIVPPSFQDSTGGQNAPSGNPGAECSGGVCLVESPEHSPVNETI